MEELARPHNASAFPGTHPLSLAANFLLARHPATQLELAVSFTENRGPGEDCPAHAEAPRFS